MIAIEIRNFTLLSVYLIFDILFLCFVYRAELEGGYYFIRHMMSWVCALCIEQFRERVLAHEIFSVLWLYFVYTADLKGKVLVCQIFDILSVCFVCAERAGASSPDIWCPAQPQLLVTPGQSQHHEKSEIFGRYTWLGRGEGEGTREEQEKQFFCWHVSHCAHDFCCVGVVSMPVPVVHKPLVFHGIWKTRHLVHHSET